MDILAEYSEGLVGKILRLAGSSVAVEPDEYAYDELFVNFELLFALQRSRLLHYYPDPDEVAKLKDTYLAGWDACMKERGGPWDERRAVIERTFNRLLWLSQKEKRRIAAGPQLVEVPPPELSDVAPDVVLAPHLVFGALHVSIPTDWSARTSDGRRNIPDQTLVRRLTQGETGTYSTGDHEFDIERIFFATGRSIGPAELEPKHDPYILLARLSRMSGRESDQESLNVHGLVCETEEALAPHYQGEGEHVSGVFAIDAQEDLEFSGLEVFHSSHAAPDGGPRLVYQSLYYHSLDEDALLLLEFGSIRASAFDSPVPDHVLIDHLWRSIRLVTREREPSA